VITVSEDINVLPDVNIMNQTGFTVKPYAKGEYAGFMLDGNGRFMLASCLVTHNTELIQTFCDATDQPFAKVNMGGSIDSSYYLGHSYTYTGSAPGVLVKTLANLKTKNNQRTKSGVVFFDEFDKIGLQSHVGNVFLHVSDPVQQKSFQDHYMSDITIDLSNLTFVYSLNDRKNIDVILQNRLPIIDLPGYSSKEKHDIISKYIVKKELKNSNMSDTDIIFTSDAITSIVSNSTKEDKDGMRRASQMVQNTINKLGALMCSYSGPGSKEIFSYTVDLKKPIRVTEDMLVKLGIFDNPFETQTYLSMYI
jgi:ATP-dependent Lon protease